MEIRITIRDKISIQYLTEIKQLKKIKSYSKTLKEILITLIKKKDFPKPPFDAICDEYALFDFDFKIQLHSLSLFGVWKRTVNEYSKQYGVSEKELIIFSIIHYYQKYR